MCVYGKPLPSEREIGHKHRKYRDERHGRSPSRSGTLTAAVDAWRRDDHRAGISGKTFLEADEAVPNVESAANIRHIAMTIILPKISNGHVGTITPST